MEIESTTENGKLSMRVIAGHLKNKKILTPKGDSTRPTSSRLRETLFNICQNEIEGCVFLDLFAGSGAMGLEALSRGAKRVTFVDQSKDATRIIHQNIDLMGLKLSSQVIQSDALKALQRLEGLGKKFDIIYVDPPYGKEFSALILKYIDDHALLGVSGMLFIEEKKGHPLALDELKTLTVKSTRSNGSSMLIQLERKGS